MLTLNRNWKFEESCPSVTAYTTTYNCILGGYPVERAISSWLWCDKVMVIDGGSTDGTKELLLKLQEKHPGKIQVEDMPIDHENPGKDGFQKAMSLAMCSTPFAIQFDIDEICLGSSANWKRLIKTMPENVHILNLPVMEPYGNIHHLRINESHESWKWRIFRVRPEITHGIPSHDRLELEGKVFSKGGSDGCYPIHIVTNDIFPSKMNIQAASLLKQKKDKNWNEYKRIWLDIVKNEEPYVLHLGHVNLKQKIRHYLLSWKQWWNFLYNKVDENIFFPNIQAEAITEEMIDLKVNELIKQTPTITLENERIL